MTHSHIWCENRRADLQKSRFHTLILNVNKHLKSCSLMPLHNCSWRGYKTLFFLIFISLQVRDIFEQHSIFGIWSCKAEDAANTTFTRSQDLCNSRHLFPSLSYAWRCRVTILWQISRRIICGSHSNRTERCVCVCVRASHKEAIASSLFIFKVSRLHSSLIVSQSVLRAASFVSDDGRRYVSRVHENSRNLTETTLSRMTTRGLN